jgi:phenylacetic acid degradation operon negative regulatory protein
VSDQAPPPPRRLITTLYGLYAREDDGWLSVAALVRLMAALGVDAAAVRSSVSRLKKRGVLAASRRPEGAGYALSAEALALLREGDQRIWSQARATESDGWLVVVFSVPEAERDRRHRLRSTLASLGFGSAAPGVWVAPGTAYDEAVAALTRSGLAGYTEFFRGDYLGSDVARRMHEWWDLESIGGLYDRFVATWQGHRSGGDTADDGAFAAYVPMLTEWRALPYLDPGLPLAHLPAGWSGIEAQRLFSDLDAELRGPAARHAHRLIHP